MPLTGPLGSIVVSLSAVTGGSSDLFIDLALVKCLKVPIYLQDSFRRQLFPPILPYTCMYCIFNRKRRESSWWRLIFKEYKKDRVLNSTCPILLFRDIICCGRFGKPPYTLDSRQIPLKSAGSADFYLMFIGVLITLE